MRTSSSTLRSGRQRRPSRRRAAAPTGSGRSTPAGADLQAWQADPQRGVLVAAADGARRDRGAEPEVAGRSDRDRHPEAQNRLIGRRRRVYIHCCDEERARRPLPCRRTSPGVLVVRSGNRAAARLPRTTPKGAEDLMTRRDLGSRNTLAAVDRPGHPHFAEFRPEVPLWTVRVLRRNSPAKRTSDEVVDMFSPTSRLDVGVVPER